jgi:tRNA modification GTPase
LFRRLQRKARKQLAIVSPIAGTTRDVIDTALDIGGYPASISDTAGIRAASPDSIERIGIDLARQRFADADIRVHVTDNDDDARRALA